MESNKQSLRRNERRGVVCGRSVSTVAPFSLKNKGLDGTRNAAQRPRRAENQAFREHTFDAARGRTSSTKAHRCAKMTELSRADSRVR
jgi:hypothetical protein